MASWAYQADLDINVCKLSIWQTRLFVFLTFAIVGNGCFYRIFSQDRAVDFNWRQFQLFGNFAVFDCQCIVKAFAFHPLGNQAGRSDGGATTVSFEFCIFDNTLIVTLICRRITSPQAARQPCRYRQIRRFSKVPTLRGFS